VSVYLVPESPTNCVVLPKPLIITRGRLFVLGWLTANDGDTIYAIVTPDSGSLIGKESSFLLILIGLV